MKGQMFTYRPESPKPSIIALEKPDLDVVKAGLNGGYLEAVPFFFYYHGQRCVAFCDEEGKGKGLPINIAATLLWHTALVKLHGSIIIDDVLCGPVVVLTGDQEFMNSM